MDREMIFIYLVLAMFIFGMGYAGFSLMKSTEEGIKQRIKLNCLNSALESYSNANDLKQFCENDNCTTYFDKRMNYSMQLAEYCVDYNFAFESNKEEGKGE